MKDVRSLLKKSIIFEKESLGLFIAIVDGERCELRINDFPDNPLFTLSYKEKSISFDNCPNPWTLNYNIDS